MTKLAVLIILSALAGYAIHAFAQARVDIRTAVTSIGTSSSNAVSFAWFFDPADRTVFVCRAQAVGDSVDCKAKTSLP
jgi:hypothetical protein